MPLTPAITRHTLPFAVFCLAVYAALTFALYGSALTAWWCCDDPAILKHALQYSPREYFAVPSAWRALVPYSLTPWLSLVYDLDYALFGLNPVGYYAHNLLTVTFCAWLIFLIARQWTPGWYAFGGGVLFLVGVPVMTAAHQLMVRHYMEGLLFYLFAFWLVMQRAREGADQRTAWLVGVAFAIAVTAKEIYLPLGLVPFLLPMGTLRQRLRTAWPFLVVMVLYLPWRWYMLGDIIGGYTPATELGRNDVSSALGQFANIPALLLAWPWLGLSGLGLMIVFLAMKRMINGWAFLLMASLSVLLLAPLIPLARQPGIGSGSERYFIALWAVCTLGTAIISGLAATVYGFYTRIFSHMVMAVLIISVWLHARQMRTVTIPWIQEQSVQGKALVSADSHDIIYLTPAVAVWYISGIVDLKQALGRTTPFPALVSDEIDLHRLARADRRILRYDRTSQQMKDITTLVPQMLDQWRAKVRPVPMSVEMVFDGATKTMRWQLGPYTEGSYTMLPNYGRQPLPPKGSLRMENPPNERYAFRYDAPDGWIAYTPARTFVTAGEQRSRLAMHGITLSLADSGGAGP